MPVIVEDGLQLVVLGRWLHLKTGAYGFLDDDMTLAPNLPLETDASDMMQACMLLQGDPRFHRAEVKRVLGRFVPGGALVDLYTDGMTEATAWEAARVDPRYLAHIKSLAIGVLEGYVEPGVRLRHLRDLSDLYVEGMDVAAATEARESDPRHVEDEVLDYLCYGELDMTDLYAPGMTRSEAYEAIDTDPRYVKSKLITGRAGDLSDLYVGGMTVWEAREAMTADPRYIAAVQSPGSGAEGW
jgi:hypothetical protein